MLSPGRDIKPGIPQERCKTYSSRSEFEWCNSLADILYILPKATNAIDFFAVTTFGNSNTGILLLIQLSIQKASNLEKCKNSLSTIPQAMFDMHDMDEQLPPHNVLYLYVNPFVDFEFDDGLKMAKDLAEPQHSWIAKSKKNWYFAMPTEESKAVLAEVHSELMDPSTVLAIV